MLYKLFFIFIILTLIFVFLLLSLGKFLDITQDAKKADIIVSLGGASGCRLKTALNLYKQGYSKSNKLIYTGKESISTSYSKINSRKDYLINNGINPKNIIHVDRSMITNTMEEVFFIKQYMLKHNYKSVLFVSHPQHSRRITTLANIIADYEGSGLHLEVISCKPSWWNRRIYYQNEISIKASISEMVKLVYNLLKYSPFLIQYTKYNSRKENKEWEKKIEVLN